MTTAKPRRPWRKIGLIAIILLTCLIGGCFVRWPAHPRGHQKTFIKPSGQSVTFTIWEAERVLKLPFFNGSSVYFQFDGQRVKIHGGDFGSGVGSFLVSPQRDFVIVERTFEGGATSGVLVELKTGKFRQWSLFSNDPSVVGWSKETWRTSLESIPREKLHQQLASIDFEAMKLAKRELEARGFNDSDWLAMARIVAEPRAPAAARKFLAFSMVYDRQKQVDGWRRSAHFGSSTMPATSRPADFDYSWPPKVDWPDEIIRLYQSVKDDPDPEIRKEVRSALNDMGGQTRK